MSYITWLAIFVWLPTALIWLFAHRILRRYPQTLFWAMIGALLFSIPWDLYAIDRIWYFPQGNLGITILNIPLEEYLFMTTVSFLVASVTLVWKNWLRGG